MGPRYQKCVETPSDVFTHAVYLFHWVRNFLLPLKRRCVCHQSCRTPHLNVIDFYCLIIMLKRKCQDTGSLCVLWRYVGWAEVQLHSFLTSAVALCVREVPYFVNTRENKGARTRLIKLKLLPCSWASQIFLNGSFMTQSVLFKFICRHSCCVLLPPTFHRL